MATAEKPTKDNKATKTDAKKTARASGTKSTAANAETRKKRAQAVATKSAAQKETRASVKDTKSCD